MHPERSNAAYRGIAVVVRPLLAAMTRQDWHGVANLPTSGGFIAVGNHITNLDPLTFALYLWNNGHAPRILAKDSLFRVPVLGPLLTATGMIPVARGTSAAANSLAAAAAALAAGECVAAFPEGTLTRDPDLWPMVAKTGVARLALTSGAPVVPIGQWGAHRVLARYGKVLKPWPRKTVTVVAGPPVDLSDLMGRPTDAATLREATTRIMAAVTDLLAQVRDEQPPDGVFDMRTGTRSGSRR